ncbi:DUF2628 domain-containing protein [Maritalea sp.]|uniref:DUF2628 domain-containing protein n=1 Tax=Maritalea sp. TaxID=2003361 RepID=UPI003EF13286
MGLFAIYAKPSSKNVAKDGPQSLITQEIAVIRDRFSIFACLLTPLWCIWHRLWLELAAFLGVAFVLGFAAFFTGESAGSWIGFLVALLIGFEASSIRGYALTRKGYLFKGQAVAQSSSEAEWRYVANMLKPVAPEPELKVDDEVEPPVKPSTIEVSTTFLSNERPTGIVQ